MKNFSDRLKEAMSIRYLRQSDVARLTGIDKSLISNYIKGTYQARQDNLHTLALALDVSEAWLMGYDVPMERGSSSKDVDNNSRTSEFIPVLGGTPLKTKKVPMLGSIACGQPIFADEQHGEYILASGDIDTDFCLRASGDSMTGARIFDGDIVFIKRQEEVENGQIAAVLIGDEATLKRVYYYPDKNKLVLSPENPTFEPLVYVGEELSEVRIIGRAVAFQSVLK